MKQGRASRDGNYGWKREPIPYAVNPKGVSQIGQAMGNKATDKGRILHSIETVYEGRGYSAPMRSQKTHNGGSQGSY